MQDSVIIAWTPTNWLTIFLMAVGGFLVIKLVTMGIKNASGSQSNQNA
jgi:hypothetical protein